MKLLSATPSPYARKVRIALLEKGIPFELVTEVPWDPEATTRHYNPLGKLPVLILDDGATVYESRFILEWLELKHPEPLLFPKDPDELLAAKRLEVLADGVCDAVVLLFWERQRPEAQRSRPWMERQTRKVEGGIKEIARLAPPGTAFCVGDRFGLGDIAVGTALGFLLVRFPELDWRGAYPHLADLHARLGKRPSFATTVLVPQRIAAGVV